jgi:GNAT superfamily N-acetyltransferase
MNSVKYIQPKDLKREDGLVLPKKMPPNSFIIGIKNDFRIQSFIFFSVYQEYVHVNYSFTYAQYRRNGYSTILREYIINYAKQNNKKRVVSVPFETANSVSLLKKLGFKKSETDDSYYLEM